MNKDGNNKLIVKQKDLKEKKTIYRKTRNKTRDRPKANSNKKSERGKKRKFKWAKSATQT